MKTTDAELNWYINRNFLFDEPVEFNTEEYIKSRHAKLDHIGEQIERLKEIKQNSYSEKVADLGSKLEKEKEDLEGSSKPQLLLYPLTVKDYNHFFAFAPSLMFDKNGPDIYAENVEAFSHAVSISYLQWVIEYSLAGVLPDAMVNISALISLSFHLQIESFVYGNEGGNPYIKINDKIVFNSDDFDSFRKIVVFQNLNEKVVDLKNEAQRDLEKVERIKSKDVESPSLEQQVVAFCASKRCSKKDVLSMTIREFLLESKMIREIEEYDLTKIGVMSGTVSFKTGNHLEHYLFKDKKREMEGFVPLDDMKRKINT